MAQRNNSDYKINITFNMKYIYILLISLFAVSCCEEPILCDPDINPPEWAIGVWQQETQYSNIFTIFEAGNYTVVSDGESFSFCESVVQDSITVGIREDIVNDSIYAFYVTVNGDDAALTTYYKQDINTLRVCNFEHPCANYATYTRIK